MVADFPCSSPNSEIVFPVISTLKIRAICSQAIETQSISTNSSRPETAPSSLSPCYQGVTETPLEPELVEQQPDGCVQIVGVRQRFHKMGGGVP